MNVRNAHASQRAVIRPRIAPGTGLACGVVLLLVSIASAQPLDEVIDEDRYIRGLTEWQLPEVLERYLELHPPTDATGAAEQQQHLDRLALRSGTPSDAEREAIIERMIARYDELLESNPDDPRRAVWASEQAGDAYFEWMMIDTAIWTALLGVPTPEQEHRIRRAAARMIDLAERAERIVLDVIFEMEDDPAYMDDRSLRAQRRRLIDEHRDRRVPFLRGVAMHLHARFNIEHRTEQTDLARRAAETLNEVIPRLDGRLRREATIHAGYARLLEGDEERAANKLARVWDDADGSSLMRFVAAAGKARWEAARRGADAAIRSLERAAGEIGVADELYYQLLLADQRVLWQDRATADAYAAYLDLIDAQPMEQRDAVRRIVLRRLAGHVHRFDRLHDAPAIVRIAHSHVRATEDDALATAINRLHTLREQTTLRDREAALALLVLGGLYGEAGRHDDAALVLLEFARSDPQHPDALPAVERALSHAVEVYRASPDAGASLLQAGLDLLFSDFSQSDTIDRWRLVAGRLALRDNAHQSAIEHFEYVSRSSAYFLEAQFGRIEAARRAAQTAVDADERYARLLELIDAVERDLRQAESAASDATHQQRHLLLRVYRAEAHVARDDAQRAIDLLDELDETEQLPATVMAEMLPVRIRAYEALGRTDEVGKEIDRLLDASPDRVLALLLPMIDAVERRVDRLVRQHRDDEAVELARRDMLPLAARLENWQEQYGESEHELIIGRRLADAYRHSNACEAALDWYDRLLEAHPGAMPLLLGRAECLFTLGRDASEQRLAEAMTVYRRLAAATAEHGGERYWLSQLRMLQILDHAERNTDRILPRIQQLRQRDEDLGGEYFRRQFEQLQAKYVP